MTRDDELRCCELDCADVRSTVARGRRRQSAAIARIGSTFHSCVECSTRHAAAQVRAPIATGLRRTSPNVANIDPPGAFSARSRPQGDQQHRGSAPVNNLVGHGAQ